jgi:hypothetical protein
MTVTKLSQLHSISTNEAEKVLFHFGSLTVQTMVSFFKAQLSLRVYYKANQNPQFL